MDFVSNQSWKTGYVKIYVHTYAHFVNPDTYMIAKGHLSVWGEMVKVNIVNTY